MKLHRPAGPRPDKFEALKPGEYLAQVISTERGQSNSGNPKIVIALRVFHGGKARKLTAHVPTTVGFRVDQLYDAFPEAIDSDGCLETKRMPGLTCQVQVLSELYLGKPSNKVDEIMYTEEEAPLVKDPARRQAQSQPNHGRPAQGRRPTPPAARPAPVDDCPF